jgi:hypothetical protein
MSNPDLEPSNVGDVDYIPKTKLAALTINYRAGFRYHIPHDGEIATSILNNKIVYVGINGLDLTSVLMEKDSRARSQSAIARGASPSGPFRQGRRCVARGWGNRGFCSSCAS